MKTWKIEKGTIGTANKENADIFYNVASNEIWAVENSGENNFMNYDDKNIKIVKTWKNYKKITMKNIVEVVEYNQEIADIL